MFTKPFRVAFALAIAIALTQSAAPLLAQESGKTRDDALDSLLEKLSGPAQAKPAPPARSPEPGKTKKPQTGRSPDALSEPIRKDAAKTKAQSIPAENRKKPGASGAATVAPKDQAIDDLLEKLGETKDAPSSDERPRKDAAGGPTDPSPAAKPTPAKLGGKDKDIDDRLEELAGRRRKRPPSDDERTGPIGEIIKEMKDVEKRLGKPDPSEDTQNKQKQIVKRIDTLIEQVRRSESTAGKLMARRMRQQGQEKGQQPDDQTGALARGAPPMKPAKPTSQHSTAGGRDIWGHLPAELRQVMENSFKEDSLSAKAEMISRYFLSVGKGKLKRED